MEPAPALWAAPVNWPPVHCSITVASQVHLNIPLAAAILTLNAAQLKLVAQRSALLLAPAVDGADLPLDLMATPADNPACA